MESHHFYLPFHKTILIVEPVENLAEEKEQVLHEKLQAYKASLSKEELQ